MTSRSIVFICVISCASALLADAAANIREPVRIDLSGEWDVVGTNFSGRASLPGTLADAGLGTLQTAAHFAAYTGPARMSMARRYRYLGPAKYRRSVTLSADAVARQLEISLERVMWASRLTIDGRDFGRCDSLGTPHVHKIPACSLAPGRHEIELEIDNSSQYGMIPHSHGWSDWMQSIWNGAIGRLELRESNPLDGVRVFADFPAGRKVRFEVPEGFVANAESITSDSLQFIGFSVEPSPYAEGRLLVTASLAQEPEAWDEFNPRLYGVEFRDRRSELSKSVRFGFRTISRSGNRLMLNGRPLFIRADVDNCGFPLTGHPDMSKREWKRILAIERNNGMNALQMHTWTPPDAAFEAADEEGVMILCELGYWEGSAGHGNEAIDDYLRRELKAVSDAYGNHPSMVATSFGNELGKCNFDALNLWMKNHKKYDPRRLTMCSTARTVADSDDFMVTHDYPGIGRTRGKRDGSTDYDYEDVYSKAPIPVVAHEIGQWPVYPMWDEQIPKFSGLLVPWRWPALREAAVSNGTFRFSREFHSASMQTCRHFYKLETEGFLRTPSCAGVEFLDVRDYTGQGEALVGWYDAFFDAKPALGEVPPFSELMRPVPFLAKMRKFLWTTSETFEARLCVRNGLATEIPAGTRWRWAFGPHEGWVSVTEPVAPGAIAEVGKVTLPLSGFAAPSRVEFRFGENRWRIYVLPSIEGDEPPPKGVLVTSDPSAATKRLAEGGSVVYTGPSAKSGVTSYQPIYWSTTLFVSERKHIGLGAVVDADHPALASTGCDYWQDEFWRALFTDGTRLATSHRLEGLPHDFRPLVTVVPDLHHSLFISPLFELRVGAGKLIVCGLNLDADSPAARLLKRSLWRYAESPGFNPRWQVGQEWFGKVFLSHANANEPSTEKAESFAEDMKNK